ncbi:bifunctional UDP-N-acetylglucosamine diphosphorylase/glucosamine-1-phosphate N-acetyltransferase GlmU [Lederbergia sp. NSJ-179]|uniref:bifunctional UDP-N-acetylglucosamine diphosphorylase/glucosamine-1-phosphate N-acetyltransferase GlmU n=1 Tax=Lederbergia sp. NSJ-179 TaxID=2931402 RepID=UPI001FD3100A|nr:bifunctional UDP-N-acetylglucosamine diphosphorylase/glucosamine-1-phosphate N-acetyltransferase GlmU [Lederbergia sp. NSJ-179]MCJ7842909.1 bifunctional UDP-N-acetylglucosamine diphosphorylase/glucosamine-1-phosphate N-acetyltransferase GlmU [Lederbergia sp. NSJ-179]
MANKFAVILAAGLGTRMKSKFYKVLHPVCGKPMVEHIIHNITKLQVSKTITVVGHGAEQVKAQLKDRSEFVIQEKQLGTAHAVMQAKALLKGKNGTTFVICGDTPLISTETLEALYEDHLQKQAKATILTAYAENPTGYGRVIRNAAGHVEKIVEHKDASEEEKKVKEINTGMYCFDNLALFEALEEVSNENSQGEYYLTDVIEILKAKNDTVTAFQTDNFSETIGINDRIALAQAEKIMRAKINERHMANGVTIIDPDNTYIDTDVEIGMDTIIYPGSFLKGKTIIGDDCHIGPHSELENAVVGSETNIRQSVVHDSSIGSRVNIGPYAHIRPQSTIHDEVKIGNFVELKKVDFGQGSKASHLSYIGDAEVGSNVNLGCGSITVNYDGKHKAQTKIEDDVFVGCNSNLVAPVTIKKNSYIAAGSTITEDVPEKALSIARARQINKEDYVKKLNLDK